MGAEGMNGGVYVTRPEFVRALGDVSEEVGSMHALWSNFIEDQRRVLMEQRDEIKAFLANQESRDKDLWRHVRKLEQGDKRLRDSFNDLEGEAMRNKYEAMQRQKNEEIARKDSLIKSLKEEKKETHGWVKWIIRAGLVGAGALAGDIIKQLFFR